MHGRMLEEETCQVVRCSYGYAPRDHWCTLCESLVRLLVVYSVTEYRHFTKAFTSFSVIVFHAIYGCKESTVFPEPICSKLANAGQRCV
jgi:hypothetical protein